MSLNDETKKLAHDVFAAIENEKRKAYHEGYTKGIMDWQKTSKMLDKWRETVRLKDAPSAMDSVPVAPVPCVKETENTSLKDLFQKLNEEVDELKVEILKNCYFDDGIDDVRSILKSYKMDEDIKAMQRIAEEGADVCTVVTSLLEAIGIGFEMRQEAQRRVNEHNKERGRW